MSKIYCFHYVSELGVLLIAGSEAGITSVTFEDGNRDKEVTGDEVIPRDAAMQDDEVIPRDAAMQDDAVIPRDAPVKDDTVTPHNQAIPEDVPACLKECISQLDEYFAGSRREFKLKLAPEGTEFQKKVWDVLLSIPYGKTASYAQVAEAAGNRKAARAVGNANNRNRIAIIIPCHRVIGSGGEMTGYAGGLWRKKRLLAYEQKNQLT